MGDLKTDPAPARDGDHLFDGLQESGPLAAHVDTEQPGASGGDFGQGGRLFRGGETGRRVHQPRGKAEGALGHPLLHHRGHASKLRPRRRPVVAAHDGLPNGVVSHLVDIVH